MRIDLSGRTALVTGSTAGIGKASATGLAAAGAEVVVNGRSAERVAEVVAELGTPARGVAADVGARDGVDALIAEVPEVDILVNNVGIFTPVGFFDIDDAEWQRVFDVNVMSGVRLARAYVPGMVERGWGRVIFVSSESALQIPTEMVHYGMTKTAQLAVSRGLAESVAETGVTVNAVLPGPTRTEGFEAMLAGMVERGEAGDLDEAGRRFIAENRPTSLLGRPTSPEEVANMIVYASSPQAAATTGAALRVDHGVVRAIP